ncbi:MAG: helix-turn-helix domain-containing protein [Rikenellaceae bacterium]
MSGIITKYDEQVVELFDTSKRITDGLDQLSEGYRPTFKGERYLTDKEVSERLKISRRTLQEWRNTGRVEYILIEGKILYAESAIQRLLDKHYQKAWQ